MHMERTVIDWLENTARLHKDKTAFISGEVTMTFGELWTEAKCIATKLAKHTIPRQPVAVMVGRHVHAPACFLGAAYAGCFYAPMDADMPAKRLQQILDVVQTNVIIVDDSTESVIESLSFEGEVLKMEGMINASIDDCIIEERRKQIVPNDPLYAIFTSGSTGVPKGVLTSHYSLMCYIDAVSGVLDIDCEDILGNQSPLDYIAAVRDIYFPVYKGATTVILPKAYFSMPGMLFKALDEAKVTAICWSSSALSIPVKLKAFRECVPSSIKKVCFSGSVLPGNVLQEWQENLPDALFVNQYGPTEATASCTYYVVTEKADENTVLPIGKPYPNYRIILLNEDMSETKQGEVGEICVAGPILALGYYNAPDRTAQDFIQNPLQSSYRELIYKTGDLGLLREDGNLEFHGRKDRQIKHLGHRVELGELEAAAKKVEGLNDACALYQKEKEFLYLFYTGDVDKKVIATELRKMIPGFMVPRKYIKLDSLPALPNGKIDMVKLKDFFE